MKRIITLFSVYAFTIAVYGQVSVSSAGYQRAPLTTLDKASIRCHYQFVQKDKAGLLQIDTMTLDIGVQMSEYYDIFRQTQDSLLSANARAMSNSIAIPNSSGRPIVYMQHYTDLDRFEYESADVTSYTTGRPKESARLFKNRQTGEIFIIDYIGFYMPERYRFSETIRPQAWQIAADTATILGYLCQKATATFRGRSYEAWFSSEIPVNDGPWKFFGLPGLILKVTDTENIFSFTCVGIENLIPSRDIAIEQIRYINTSRDELTTIKVKQGGQTMYTNIGGDIYSERLKAKDDYHPLELE